MNNYIFSRLAAVFTFASAIATPSDPHPILSVSDDAWGALNASVSGRLFIGFPHALPCYTNYENSTKLKDNDVDVVRCNNIRAGLTNSSEIIADFGSYHNPSFSTCMAKNEKCTLSPDLSGSIINATCYQGSVPDYYVDAHTVEDVQEALKFAQHYRLPLTVKNTGHELNGKSTGPRTFAIWTHNILPDISVSEDFIPESCDDQALPAVTFGAGQTAHDLYSKLDGSGYFAVGGSCPTVGVSGGWLLGGGHGVLTPKFGLGVDNALQMKVVLPNGSFITTNRCQNQDLFFALRGGGGGTFGIVTETTTRLHRDQSFTYVVATMTVPTGPREITRILVENADRWADEGWGGYVGVETGNSTAIIGFNPSLSVDEARESFKPVLDFFESIKTGSNPYTVNITSFPNHWTMQNAPEYVSFAAYGNGFTVARSSRLVPRETFSGDAKIRLVETLTHRGWGALLATPSAYNLPESDQPGGPGEASVTPAWRNSLWHVTFQNFWDPADPVVTAPHVLAETFFNISRDMDDLRALTPTGGAYLNEADLHEPDPIKSFWGQEHYDRLLNIKQTLDPHNILSCYTCIGWDRTDSRYQCYPSDNP